MFCSILGVTVIAMVALAAAYRLSAALVAVIVAVPTEFAVITPLYVTLTTASSVLS